MKVENIDIGKIKANPNQPRKYFDIDKMSELMLSVTAKEIISPITVRSDNNGGYEVIAGERRFRAMGELNKNPIPCIIRNVDDTEALEISVIENLQRINLTSTEVEDAIYNIWKTDKYPTHNKLADAIGFSQPHTTNAILAYESRHKLNLPKKVNDAVSTQAVAYSDRLAPEVQKKVLVLVANKKITAHDVKKTVNDLKQFKEPEQQLEVLDKVISIRKDAKVNAKKLEDNMVEEFVQIAKGNKMPTNEVVDVSLKDLNKIYKSYSSAMKHTFWTDIRCLPANQRDVALDSGIALFLQLAKLIKDGDRMDKMNDVKDGKIKLNCKTKMMILNHTKLSDEQVEWAKEKYKDIGE